jgi:hypothetical protein
VTQYSSPRGVIGERVKESGDTECMGDPLSFPTKNPLHKSVAGFNLRLKPVSLSFPQVPASWALLQQEGEAPLDLA